jgi:hypothetical protein
MDRRSQDVMELSAIHALEVGEKYPDAIDALGERLRVHPDEAETVIRLGFNLWYAVAEDCRMGTALPVEAYAARFMALLQRYESECRDNADFCWAYGLGLSLFWYYFPMGTEEQGDRLLARAASLSPMWGARHTTTSQEELCQYCAGRGIFASYYACE